MKCVSFIWDRELDKQLDKIEQISDRCALVNELVSAYKLKPQLLILENNAATDEQILSFHTTNYLERLKTLNNFMDSELDDEDEEEFGLGYDCPVINGIYDFAKAVAGSSISAAHSLNNGTANIAINWYGGWHHAQRDGARGFCYVNDIVCAINTLRQKFPRVMYIDLDIHHGDGVENAFAFSRNVLTLSFHKYEVGFYPGSGAIEDIGKGNGKYYSINVPLKDGIRDEPYCNLFDRVSCVIVEAFKPDVVVVQCGCDSLAGDPLGTFNLTLKAYGFCAKKILSWQKPCLFLGGGGYHITNTARCWTYLTSLILDYDISSDIPDNRFFTRYGPGFELDITQGNRTDCNSEEHIKNCVKTITDYTSNIKKPCWN